MNSTSEFIAELNHQAASLKQKLETAMARIRQEHAIQLKTLTDKQEAAQKMLVELINQHAADRKTLLETQQMDIASLNQTIATMTGNNEVRTASLNRAGNIASKEVVQPKQKKKSLAKKIAEIIQRHDGSSDVSYIQKILQRDYGWTGSRALVSAALAAHCGVCWRRIVRGRYASIPKRSVSLRGVPANVIFALKYALPVVEMVLQAVREAKEGKPVVKSDIQEYITKRWAKDFNINSITPAIYSKLVPNGKVMKLGDGVFQAVQ